MECPEMPIPLCLVENTGDGFTVNETTSDIISQIKIPLMSVAIVGPYRGGKSFLLNRLMGKNKGFPVGSSVQAKTKGIWVWCRPHPDDPNVCLLLLDTEGFGHTEKGNLNNDIHMFALTTLLSSILIYNSKGNLDNDTIKKLSFVSELTNVIGMRASTNEEDGKDFAKFFPDQFVWTIRDFELDLDIDGRQITADDYLDNALAPKKGNGKEVSAYNKTRECLQTYFRSHKCFLFDRPIQDKNKIKVLDELEDRELDPEFVKQAEDFCRFIHSSRVKTYEGRSLKGSGFVGLLKQFVECFNSGGVPNLGDAIDDMSKTENQKAVSEALEKYKEFRKSLSLPTDTVKELSDGHQMYKKRAMDHFRKTVFIDKENAYQYELEKKIEEQFEQLLAENEDTSSKVCRKLLSELGADLERNLSSGKYAKPGGFDVYSKDKQLIEDKFNASPGRGVMAELTLREYMEKKEAEGNNILCADKELTQKEKDAADLQKKLERSGKKEKLAKFGGELGTAVLFGAKVVGTLVGTAVGGAVVVAGGAAAVAVVSTAAVGMAAMTRAPIPRTDMDFGNERYDDE